METRVRCVEYYYTTVRDEPGGAYRVLTRLAAARINLLAFNVMPVGPEYTHLVLFPESIPALARYAEETHMVLIGPQRALLAQGDDRLGALAQLHQKLFDANINVYAATGITDGRSCFGYLMYVKPEEFERAAHVLGAEFGASEEGRQPGKLQG